MEDPSNTRASTDCTTSLETPSYETRTTTSSNNSITSSTVRKRTYEHTFIAGAGFSDANAAKIFAPENAPRAPAESRRNHYKENNTSRTRSLTSDEREQKTVQALAPTTRTTENQCASRRNEWALIFNEKDWKSYAAYLTALAAKDKVAMEFFNQQPSRECMKRNVTEVISRAIMLSKQVPYQERLESCTGTKDSADGKTKRAFNAIYNLLAKNTRVQNEGFWEPLRGYTSTNMERDRALYLISEMMAVLTDKRGKRRGLAFWGVASSGKTFLANAISSCIPEELIGMFNMQGARSTFWFQPLVGKDMYQGDEIKLETHTAQTFKLLCEGNPTLTTDIKHAEHVKVPYRPVIVTSNEPCYACVNAEKGPIMERCLEIQFIDAIKHVVSMDRKVLANAWGLLVKQATEMWPITKRCDDEDEHFNV